MSDYFRCCSDRFLMPDLKLHIKNEPHNYSYCSLCDSPFKKNNASSYREHIIGKKHQQLEEEQMAIYRERDESSCCEVSVDCEEEEEPHTADMEEDNEPPIASNFNFSSGLFDVPSDVSERSESSEDDNLFDSESSDSISDDFEFFTPNLKGTEQFDMEEWRGSFDQDLLDHIATSNEPKERIQKWLKLLNTLKPGCVPENTTQLDVLLVSRKFPLKRTKIKDFDCFVWHFDLKEILLWNLKNQDNFEPLVWDYEKSDTIKHDCNGQLWKHQSKVFGKSFRLKLYMDEFLMETRNKLKVNNLCFGLGNHTFNDQMKLDSKFCLALLNKNKGNKREIFQIIRQIVIEPLAELQVEGFQFEGEEIKATISSPLTDMPAQNFWSGIMGLRNRRCICVPHQQWWSSELNCKKKKRNSANVKPLYDELEQELRNKQKLIGPCRRNLNDNDLDDIARPPFLDLPGFEWRYHERFGICSEHLLVEGIAGRFFPNLAQKQTPEDLTALNEVVSNFKYPKGMKSCNKPIMAWRNDKRTDTKVLKISSFTAEQTKTFIQFAPFFYKEIGASQEILSFVTLFAEICCLCFKREIKKSEVENLREKIDIFLFRYKNEFKEEVNDFPNLHTMNFLPESIIFLGPLWCQSSMPYETCHRYHKVSTGNNHDKFFTKLWKWERRRLRNTVVKDKSVWIGLSKPFRNAYWVNHLNDSLPADQWLQTETLRILGKLMREGEYFKIGSTIIKASRFIVDSSKSKFSIMGQKFNIRGNANDLKCYRITPANRTVLFYLNSGVEVARISVVKVNTTLYINNFFFVENSWQIERSADFEE